METARLARSVLDGERHRAGIATIADTSLSDAEADKCGLTPKNWEFSMHSAKRLLVVAILTSFSALIAPRANADCVPVCITVERPKVTLNPLQPIKPGQVQVGDVTVESPPPPKLKPEHAKVHANGNSEFAKAVNAADDVREKMDHAEVSVSGSWGSGSLREKGEEEGELDDDKNSTCGPCRPKSAPEGLHRRTYFERSSPPTTYPGSSMQSGPTMQQARPDIIPPAARGIPMTAPSPLEMHPGQDGLTYSEMNPRTEPVPPTTAVPMWVVP
jgi:hypothetical protein